MNTCSSPGHPEPPPGSGLVTAVLSRPWARGPCCLRPRGQVLFSLLWPPVFLVLPSSSHILCSESFPPSELEFTYSDCWERRGSLPPLAPNLELQPSVSGQPCSLRSPLSFCLGKLLCSMAGVGAKYGQ